MKVSCVDDVCTPFKTEWRSATVLKIIDGDTFDLDVDLGFDVHTVTRFRLYEVDTWEVRGEERERGLLAAQRVHELIPVGSTVRILSHKGGTRGKYGRWLAEVLYRMESGDWYSLGYQLLQEGHGEEYGK